jgi:hypothetical protein
MLIIAKPISCSWLLHRLHQLPDILNVPCTGRRQLHRLWIPAGLYSGPPELLLMGMIGGIPFLLSPRVCDNLTSPHSERMFVRSSAVIVHLELHALDYIFGGVLFIQ